MSAQSIHLESAQDLALLLGPRQADIMRLIWRHGSATVREIHSWLTTDTQLAYTTVMTICVSLNKKGLLTRRRVTVGDPRTRKRNAYVYTPYLSEAEFTRAAIERRIEPVLAQYPASGACPCADHRHPNAEPLRQQRPGAG